MNSALKTHVRYIVNAVSFLIVHSFFASSSFNGFMTLEIVHTISFRGSCSNKTFLGRVLILFIKIISEIKKV